MSQTKHIVPAGTHALGMGLFLATLSMLFGAGMLLYWMLRLRTGNDAQGLPLHSIDMPWLLFVSTPCMLLASACIHLALGKIRRNQISAFKTMLGLGAFLSLVFVCLQIPSLWILAQEHAHAIAPLGVANNDEAVNPSPSNHAFFGTIVFLIVVHAAHVLGGIIPLGIVLVNALNGKYAQAEHTPVRLLVWYWHFLDVVWIVLFGSFLILG